MKIHKNTILPWLRKYGLFTILFLAGAGVLAVDKATKELSVRLSGYNYMQQSIYYFTVNGAMGSNLVWGSRSGGGGAISCCTEISGDTVKIKWQIDRIDKDEIYERVIKLPPRPSKPPRFLEVHFFPNQEIKLRWSDWPREPLLPIREFEEVEKERAQQNLLQEQKK